MDDQQTNPTSDQGQDAGQSSDSSGVPHLTVDDFDQTLQQAGDKPVLVDFYADWCGPCQLAAPVIEKLAVEYKDKAVIAKVDVDAHNQLAQKYGVMSIPTVLLFHKGVVKDKQVGYSGENMYTTMLKKVLGS